MIPALQLPGLRKLGVTLVAVLVLLTTRGAVVGVGQRGGGGRGGAVDPKAQALKDAIDIHVHSHPDNADRAIDGLEAAMLARASGMRGLVLKNHYDPTAGLAYMVRKQVPGLEVFGGIDLNLTVGGMNPIAVEHLSQLAGGWGKFVWMSTFDAENQVKYSKENRPFVTVAKNGELLPATKEVIAVIAKHNLVLATGHVAPEEGLMMLREGHRVGVQHMVVTHAVNAPVLMNVAQMQAAAKEGAFIEFCGSTLVPANAQERMDRFADAIRKVGPEFVILSTDLGQTGNPLPPDGLAAFIMALKARGFTDQELDRMSKQNPAKLLGLP